MKKLTLALVISAITGCAQMPNPETATVAQRPATAPMKTLTSFSEALSCMDDLMLSRGVKNIVITSAGIPDQTGEIRAGTKEMMISAISKMSIKSNGFRFVDYDPMEQDVHLLHQMVGIRPNFVIPNYYIRGAISQLDRGALSDSQGFGLSFMGGGDKKWSSTEKTDGNVKKTEGSESKGNKVGAGIGYDEQAASSVISMDLNMGEMVTRQILPGISATNSIVLTTKGQGFNLDASIQKVGINYNMSVSRAEGPHAAVRTLVELSLIEILGKLAEVPYWQCLGQGSTSPDLFAKTREAYDKVQPQDRVKSVQTALTTAGYYMGPVTGSIDETTRESISRYQAENNLIANGRVDFDLYYNLVVNNYLAGPVVSGYTGGPSGSRPASGGIAGSSASTSTTDHSAGSSSQNRGKVALMLSSGKGGKPSLSVGENLQVKVAVSESAFVYCFYQDSTGQVSRIFPNRFSPNASLANGQAVRIPPASSPFQLVMDHPGNRERVDCVASRKELGLALPKNIQADDLEPIAGQTIDGVVKEFMKLDSNIAHEYMPIVVRP